MEFLNKISAHSIGLYRSLTPGARVTAGLLLVLAVASIGYLARWEAGGADQYLMSGIPIDPSQLPAVEAAFAKAGLSDYEVEGGRVRVPRGQHTRFMAALADGDALPRNFGDYLDQVFTQSGPFTSSRDREALLRIAKQKELSSILRMMHGIAKAAVMYDIQEGRGLQNRGRIITASVSVQPSGSGPLDESKVPALRNLVAGAIAGLDARNVSVQDLSTGRVFPLAGDSQGIGGAENDAYALRKRAYENDWREKILRGLSMVPGIDVVVNVELDPELKHHEKQRSLGPGPSLPNAAGDRGAATSASIGRDNLSTDGASSDPSVARGSVASEIAAAMLGRGTSADREAVEMLGHAERIIEKAPLTPRRVKVAIGVPSTYVESVWKSKYGTESAATKRRPAESELQEIESSVKEKLSAHVRSLIPQSGFSADTDLDVMVTVFPDVMPKTEIADPPPSSYAIQWLAENGGRLGLGFLALASLVLLRSMVRSAARAGMNQATSASPGPSLNDAEARGVLHDAADGPQGPHRPHPESPGRNDEILQMVRNNPDAAAAILKSWMAGAN